MVSSKSFVVLVLSFSSLHCRLSIIWKGATVTDPVLIYHDEVPSTATDIVNALSCLSSGASWYFPSGTAVSFGPTRVDSLYQIRVSDGTATRLVNNFLVAHPMISNGLWTCRLNSSIISVGIYQEGVITSNQVSLSSSSFMDDPPTFTLTGETRGGPPTMYSWTRDAEEIMNNSSFNISISLKGVPERFIESVYVSTLVVTGNLPGVYQYAVTNRAMTDVLTQSININDGGRVRNLTAEQVEVGTVLISWTAPSPAPARGYRITTSQHNETVIASTSHTISTTQLGYHTISVQPLSQHYPGETISVQTIVRGITNPKIALSLDGKLVNVSWTQPEFSLSVREYTVSLSRVIGSGQEMCPLVEDNRPAVTTTGNSMFFSDLEEFSTYRVTITAIYDVFGGTSMASMSEEFTTFSAAPNPIDCIERNGNITHYEVVFQKLDGTRIPGEVAGRKFTAYDLNSTTSYTFQVAGVNDVSTGPFVDLVIRTEYKLQESSTQIVVLPLFTTIGIAISIAVLFGAIGFTVGVVVGFCKRKKKKQNRQIIEASTLPIDPETNVMPEYEEINLCKMKPADYKLENNSAYGIS